MTQQSNTTESDLAYADAREKYMLGEDGNDWFNRCVAMLECARKLERERDEARKSKECFAGLLKYISDKVPSEGGKEVGDAIDSIVQERDQLRNVADELAALLTVLFEPMPEGSFHPDNPVGQTCYPLLNYNNLPHVIERKEMK